MTVTSPLLRGLVGDPRVDELLRGLVGDPRVAELLRRLVGDPRVAEYLRGLVSNYQEFPQDQPLSLKTLFVVLFSSLSLKSFWRGIG